MLRVMDGNSVSWWFCSWVIFGPGHFAKMPILEKDW